MAGRSEPHTRRRAVWAGSGLAACFLVAWLGLTACLATLAARLWPSLVRGDPAGALAGVLLLLLAAHLGQGLWYAPRRPGASAVFIRERLFAARLAFLLLPGGPKTETGPALEAVADAGQKAALLAEAEARLAGWTPALQLALLLENRSPADLGLRVLARALPVFLSWPVWILYLVLSPSRQFLRLWGYIFFRAWEAFRDPGPVDGLTDLKRRVAFDLVRRAGELSNPGDEPPTSAQLARILAALRRVYHDPFYGRAPGETPETTLADDAGLYTAPHLAPHYRGVYLDLPAALGGRTVEELFDQGREESPDLFYPPELGDEVELAALLAAERDRLNALLAERREEGILWLDGRPTPTWRAAETVFDLEDRLERLRKRAAAHHRRCRGSHLAAARRAGQGWPELLTGLAGLVHFAEHSRQALIAASQEFTRAATARQSRKGLRRRPVRAGGGIKPSRSESMISLAAGLFTVIREVTDRLAGLELPPELEIRPLEVERTAPLSPPVPGHLETWLKDWPAKADELARLLDALRLKALAALLAAEEQLDRFTGLGAPLPPAPPAPVPAPAADYPVSLQLPNPPKRVYYPAARLGAGVGRCVLAGAVLALLAWQGQNLGLSRLTIYNGLARAVTVTVDDHRLSLKPFGHAEGPGLRPGKVVRVLASAGGRPIEQFSQRAAPAPGREVYSVAGAAPLMEWRSGLTPDPAAEAAARFLGRPRWLATTAAVLFQAAPPDGEALILSGYGDSPPGAILDALPEDEDRRSLILLRARWDSPLSPWYRSWLALVPEKDAAPLLLERLAAEPDYLDQCVRWFEGTGAVADEDR